MKGFFSSQGHRSLINLYHIRIIPISWSSKIGKFSFMVAIVINNVKDISKRVLNVTIISPEVARLLDERIVR